MSILLTTLTDARHQYALHYLNKKDAYVPLPAPLARTRLDATDEQDTHPSCPESNTVEKKLNALLKEEVRHTNATQYMLSAPSLPALRLDNYIKIMQIGQGAYGDVWLADDIKNNCLVALKKLTFGEEKEGFSKNGIREISLLRYLRNYLADFLITEPTPDTQGLRHPEADSGVAEGESFSSLMDRPTPMAKGSVWMVFEYVPFDLNGIMERHKENDNQFTPSEVKRIVYDILKALEFCHSHNIMHRDLKSANLLVSSEGRVKLADFGLARMFDARTVPLTNRVITFWYRPPELLLGSDWYTPSVDIWSMGCIFAELVLNKAIFGADREAMVLKAIADTLGPPCDMEWEARKSLPLWNVAEANPLRYMPANEPSVTFPHSAYPASYLSSSTTLGSRPEHNVWSRLRDRIGDSGVDLLKSMLRYNPKSRISAASALCHPWIASDNILDGVLLSRFTQSYCHAYAFRKDKERQNQKVSGTLPQKAATKRARILSNVDFLRRFQRNTQNSLQTPTDTSKTDAASEATTEPPRLPVTVSLSTEKCAQTTTTTSSPPPPPPPPPPPLEKNQTPGSITEPPVSSYQVKKAVNPSVASTTTQGTRPYYAPRHPPPSSFDKFRLPDIGRRLQRPFPPASVAVNNPPCSATRALSNPTPSTYSSFRFNAYLPRPSPPHPTFHALSKAKYQEHCNNRMRPMMMPLGGSSDPCCVMYGTQDLNLEYPPLPTAPMMVHCLTRRPKIRSTYPHTPTRCFNASAPPPSCHGNESEDYDGQDKPNSTSKEETVRALGSSDKSTRGESAVFTTLDDSMEIEPEEDRFEGVPPEPPAPSSKPFTPPPPPPLVPTESPKGQDEHEHNVEANIPHVVSPPHPSLQGDRPEKQPLPAENDGVEKPYQLDSTVSPGQIVDAALTVSSRNVNVHDSHTTKSLLKTLSPKPFGTRTRRSGSCSEGELRESSSETLRKHAKNARSFKRVPRQRDFPQVCHQLTGRPCDQRRCRPSPSMNTPLCSYNHQYTSHHTTWSRGMVSSDAVYYDDRTHRFPHDGGSKSLAGNFRSRRSMEDYGHRQHDARRTSDQHHCWTPYHAYNSPRTRYPSTTNAPCPTSRSPRGHRYSTRYTDRAAMYDASLHTSRADWDASSSRVNSVYHRYR